MSTSTDQLPLLNAPYPLSSDKITAFQQDGHVLLRGVCSMSEVEAYRDLFRAVVQERTANYAPMEERNIYGKAFLQIMNLWRDDERYKRFVFARRFAKIAAELLQVDAVRMYHDQALFKEAGGGYTPWHQDQYYWPLDTGKTITMWMPLMDISADSGVMNFASGSHKDGYLSALDISEESEKIFDDLVRKRGYEIARGVAMNAGDATFHAGWTLHNAPPNTTDRVREVMTVIYFADGARVVEPDSEHRKNDLAAWLPGCVPGDLAASALNPVVYP